MQTRKICQVLRSLLIFRKAFDTIEWDFLSDTLSKFNFGPDVKNWVKIFYNNVTSCVLNNGHDTHV